VAVWHQRKWGNEDLVVYQIANDKIKREEKIWPEVVKYFDRDFHQRFLKKYPKESDSYTFVADNSDVKSFEFKDNKLLLNISAENKPNLAPGPVWSAELHGIWDLDKARFNRVDFKPGEISVRKPEDRPTQYENISIFCLWRRRDARFHVSASQPLAEWRRKHWAYDSRKM